MTPKRILVAFDGSKDADRTDRIVFPVVRQK